MADKVTDIPVGLITDNLNNRLNIPVSDAIDHGMNHSDSTPKQNREPTSEIQNETVRLDNGITGTFMNEDDSDDASVLVIILQCETRPCDENIANLKWVFSDPYFTVQVCSVDPPTNMPVSKTLTEDEYMENYRMRKALTYAAEGPYIPKKSNPMSPNLYGTLEPQYWWTKIPVIIVKDSSISNVVPGDTRHLQIGSSNVGKRLSTDKGSLSKISEYLEDTQSSHGKENTSLGGMKKRIKVALEKAQQADLFFLCKWNDACNKQTDIEGNIDHGSKLKWSVQPTATQAIMYTPSSRNYIRTSLMTANITLSELLNTNISQGKLMATVFVPNIIDFDVDLAISNNDYAKLNECAPVPTNTENNNNVAPVIWFMVLIILMILVAWMLIQIST
jgi:hypothetical protein